MDRQDIDALLIGALYGELTPADEARLATHLESHPADRGALDDLKVARQQVHDSRIFAVQLDPPQAISALLLQEAHRRAPKAVAAEQGAERDGWFARFARNFMAHPAMAAAAMLVLVLGGAGIVYMRKGDAQFASQEVAMQSESRAAGSAAMADQPGAAPTVVPAADPASATGASDKGGAYGTAGGAGYEAQLYEGGRPDEAEKREQTDVPAAKAKQKAIAVGSADRAPKDFAKNDTALSRDDGSLDGRARTANAPAATKTPTRTAAKGAAASDDEAFGGVATSNAISGANYAQPPPPPPPGGGETGSMKKAAPQKAAESNSEPSRPMQAAPQAPAPVTLSPAAPPSAERPAIDSKAEAKPAPTKEQSAMTWAKEQHLAAVRLAKSGDCTGAAKIAVAVSKQAPAYYTQNMATDRSLKSCSQYINAERERDSERTKKARATDTK